MSAQKTSVLFEFEEQKKQISIPNCDTEEVPEDLLDILVKRIDGNIRLVIDYGARRSSSSESQRGGATHILQRLSEQWGQFVDVIHLVEVGNGDHLKAVPFPRAVAVKDARERTVTVSIKLPQLLGPATIYSRRDHDIVCAFTDPLPFLQIVNI